jgi:uncharacterized protein YdeI (BOF family)
MYNFKEKQIKDIKVDDIIVAVSGIVVNKEGNSFMLDDSSGQIGVVLESVDFNNGDYVRVFGKVFDEDGLILQGEFAQDLSKINKKLHQKVIKNMC